MTPSRYQNNSAVQNAFLDQLAAAIGRDKQVIIVTDAGFRSRWCHHIRSLGWHFVGRVRGRLYFQITGDEEWQMAQDIASTTTPRYLGFGRLARNASCDCHGHFYTVHKRATGRGINRWFQANSEKSGRVLSYLTLSENVIRQSPGILSGMNPDRVYADMAKACRNIIMVY